MRNRPRRPARPGSSGPGWRALRGEDTSDIVERLRSHASTGNNASQWPSDMRQAADEIERLRTALGRCPISASGKHTWAIFPIGQDGRIYNGPHPESGALAAGAFCQFCQIPKSPYHDAVA
jgi:hypothetical protein